MLCMGVCVVHGDVMHGEVCTLGMLCMGGDGTMGGMPHRVDGAWGGVILLPQHGYFLLVNK